MIKNLSSLLDRISRAVNKDKIIKNAVADAIELISKVKLEEHQISIRDGVLEVSASSPAKNEISMREKEILSNLRVNNKVILSRITYR